MCMRNAPPAMLPAMTTSTPETRGQICYTAYCKRVDFKSVHGEDLPMWHEVRADLRAAWIAAADVIWQLATTGSATIS